MRLVAALALQLLGEGHSVEVQDEMKKLAAARFDLLTMDYGTLRCITYAAFNVGLAMQVERTSA